MAIAGAGPVGLTAALALAHAGVPVHVLESAAGISEDLRASTFHPPTLDMLDAYGVTDELLAQGLVCPHWQVRLHPGGDRAVFDLSVLAGDTAHPYRLQCEQYKLSRVLLGRLAAFAHVTVSFGATVESIVQDDGGVTTTFLQDGETRQLRSLFLIGADGARSVARAAIAAEFEGETFPETTVLATTKFAFEEALEGLSHVSYCWREGAGNFSLLKVPGRWRVSIYPPEGTQAEDMLADETIEAALQAIVPCSTPYEVLEKRAYRVHQRVASHYGLGRIWLAGDAAHLNSPAGGMGMNGGIHDALNLSEKLVRILQGNTGGARADALLSLYERQRKPVAQEQIIQQAGVNRARMRERDPVRRREALQALQAVTDDPERLRSHLLRSSMIEGLRQAAAVQ
ncbi:MAG: monooxygenase FAD-binding protein [Polaromonas sp.]|nr:monooxygenase FAD-binding protein [Polaromonas sp.]